MKHYRAKPLACLQAIQPSAVWCCALAICTWKLHYRHLARVTTRMRMCNCTQLCNMQHDRMHMPDQQFRYTTKKAKKLC